jgi:hypothetical protein
MLEESEIRSLRNKKGEKLTKKEQQIKTQTLRTAMLISKYGKMAAVSLSGRNLQFSDVEEVLKSENRLSDHFFELIAEAEKNSLKNRFW